MRTARQVLFLLLLATGAGAQAFVPISADSARKACAAAGRSDTLTIGPADVLVRGTIDNATPDRTVLQQLRLVRCGAAPADVTRASTTAWAVSPAPGVSIGITTGVLAVTAGPARKFRVRVCPVAPRTEEGTQYCPAPVEARPVAKGVLPAARLPAGVLARTDFESGTIAPFTNPWGDQTVTVIDDPTGAGKGKVARIHYKGAAQDVNRAVMFEHRQGIGLGETIVVKGDVYLPPEINTNPQYAQRKLMYFQRLGGPEFWTVLTMFGTQLRLDNGYVPARGPSVITVSPLLTVLQPGRWYTIEVLVTLNSSPSSYDGIARVWIDGAMLYERTNLRWSDPAWPEQPSPQRFGRWLIGDQVNSSLAFDEYRYWDNVTISTTRVP